MRFEIVKVLNHRINTITVRGFVDPKYFVPGPFSVRTEGEDGVFLSRDGTFDYSSDESVLSPFSGRGFADFDFGTDDDVRKKQKNTK